MIDKIRRTGWAVVEIGAIIVALAILLSLIIGKDNIGVVGAISDNAISLLQALPAGTIVGLALLGLLFQLVRSRLKI